MRPMNYGLCPVPFRTDTVLYVHLTLVGPAVLSCYQLSCQSLVTRHDSWMDTWGTHICVHVSISCMATNNRLAYPISAGKYSCFTELLIQRCCSFRRLPERRLCLLTTKAQPTRRSRPHLLPRPLTQIIVHVLEPLSKDIRLQQEWVL